MDNVEAKVEECIKIIEDFDGSSEDYDTLLKTVVYECQDRIGQKK